MDFVLRDSYMSGYNSRAFDLDRLLHYSFFSERGLTVHARGLPALVRFLSVRAELFRTIYFHRAVRGIDLTLSELFSLSKSQLFPGNPLEHLDQYRLFTEWSLLVDVARWPHSEDAGLRALGEKWDRFLRREMIWRMACERTLFFGPGQPEQASIFHEPAYVERQLRSLLPAELRELPLRVDLARHVNRPGTRGPTGGVNFLFDPSSGQTRPLTASELFRQLPLAYRICRVYTQTTEHDAALGEALDRLISPDSVDDKTNM